MKVVESNVKSYKVTELENLDPITIMVEDFGEGRAEVTIKIYGESWTSYWGSMGGSVKEFFTRTNVQYLVNCFERGIRATSDVKDTCAMLTLLKSSINSISGDLYFSRSPLLQRLATELFARSQTRESLQLQSMLSLALVSSGQRWR